MSVLLEGPMTEPRGGYQSGRNIRGPYMSIETVLLIVIVTFGFASVLNRWDMRLKRRGQE
jgi:hypothetical protein